VSGIFLLLLAGTNRTSWLYPCTQYKPSWQDGDSSRRVVFHPRAKATALSDSRTIVVMSCASIIPSTMNMSISPSNSLLVTVCSPVA
ncbi:MAG: hypothetical protein ABWU14_22260, partial [Limnospira maxima]